MTTSLLMSKIIDISEARRRRNRQVTAMSMNEQDNRREDRVESNERLFVQIVTSDDQDLVGTTISCEALDVSASGMRIQTALPIPVGCQLDLWVDNSAGPGKFFLSSDVKWVKAVEGRFQAGVHLFDGSATDISEWRLQYA